MTAHQFNSFNCFLIGLSLLIAAFLPLELFLFAYAVLGPAHYLTEINWLKNQGFYTRNSNQIWVLIALTAIIAASFLLPQNLNIGLGKIDQLPNLLSRNYGGMIFLTLLLSIGLVYTRNWGVLLLIGMTGGTIIYFIKNLSLFQMLTLFIPTLIHVYLFTLLFMVSGVLQTRNRVEILAIALFVLGPVILFLIPLDLSHYQPNELVVQHFKDSGFNGLSFSLANMVSAKVPNKEQFLLSGMGLKVQAFVAFAYTYHYLNWFTKVSIIGWIKKTNWGSLLLMATIWLGAVVLYYTDYKTGLTVLFFLSLLHVVLEFPLNVVVMKKIFSHKA